MYKLSVILATSAAVFLVLLLITKCSDGVEEIFTGCDVPPQFWCSSEEVARKCQVCDSLCLKNLAVYYVPAP